MHGREQEGPVEGQVYSFRPIGVIHSPHTMAKNTPIQPVYAQGIEGTVEVFGAFEEGLQDLDGFSHLHLFYLFNRDCTPKMLVAPFLQDQQRGVFATRAPCRPNPLGMSLVRLTRREGGILHVADIDVLDGTPLLDIKPYVTRFDTRPDARCGWQDEVDEETAERRGRRQD